MQPTTDGLIADLKAMITGFFPDSHVSVELSTAPMAHSPHESSRIGRTSVRILFAYGTRDSWPHGIIENDRAFHQFSISGVSGSLVRVGVLPDKLSASCFQGRDVHGPNHRNVVKVGWRERNSSTPELIIRHMTAYFAKLKAAIVSHPDADEWNS